MKITNIIKKMLNKKPVVAVLKLSGIIGPGSQMKAGLNLDSVNDRLEEAFNVNNLKAVALIINSPGGSPVQSELIFNKIRLLADEKKVKVITFIEDVAASGGYWIACSGEEIYAAQNSIIGSIGVVSAGFGFYNAISKLGVERRVYTQGKSKAILDPFMPEKESDIQILKDVQKDIYDNFKNLVLSRRLGTSPSNHDEIFSGAFWSSKKAKELGLIDEVADFYSVIDKKYGKKTRIKKINFAKSWIKSLIGSSFDTISQAIFARIEEKYISSKFGL